MPRIMNRLCIGIVNPLNRDALRYNTIWGISTNTVKVLQKTFRKPANSSLRQQLRDILTHSTN